MSSPLFEYNRRSKSIESNLLLLRAEYNAFKFILDMKKTPQAGIEPATA